MVLEGVVGAAQFFDKSKCMLSSFNSSRSQHVEQPLMAGYGISLLITSREVWAERFLYSHQRMVLSS
jgi:uncharacterized protein YgiB involved in biofilm formation